MTTAGTLTILAFNWHEPYLHLLAKTGHRLLVCDWARPWRLGYRPLPPNATCLGSEEEATALIRDRRVDVVLCQNAADLVWLGDKPAATIFLSHNVLTNEVTGRDERLAGQLREFARTALAARHGVFVTISEVKRESWGLDGLVIPPGIDPQEHGGYTGEAAEVLTVGNLLRERSHMLGTDFLEAALAGLPWRVVGQNPGLPGDEAESWEALRALYRRSRLYANATTWPWEDGYNLAMLEAMATGMPVVSLANPTSPIREGVEGFLAEDAESFRRWTLRLLEDPDLARRMGANARRAVAERFPLDAFVERWNEAFRRCLGAASRATPNAQVRPIPQETAGADLFPWAPGEITTSLARCPAGAFHITGMRLERLSTNRWWGDLTGYREDLKSPFTLQGFRIAEGWPATVTLPPYLADLEDGWRTLIVAAVAEIAESVFADPETSSKNVIYVSVSVPDHIPVVTKVGGDRITPGDTFVGIYVHHAKRYRFAARFGEGKTVLDLGCGVGYGSRMLAQTARQVVGIEISAEAVTYASHAYHGPRLSFGVGDARQLPFPDGTFDLVVCFEMIEQIREQQQMLKEIARVLRPGGQLIISTPNKLIYERFPDPDHFHCGLLERREFEHLLRAEFSQVQLWAQPRFRDLAEITLEFEIERDVHDGQEMFIAVATGSRRVAAFSARRGIPEGQTPRRLKVVVATAGNPIATSSYYERALRRHHDVRTWGPTMDDGTLGQWQAVADQHALKAAGSAEEKIALLRGLIRPADHPCPKGTPDVRELLRTLPAGWRPDLFLWIDNGPDFLPLGLEALDCPTACLMGDSHTQLDWRLRYAQLFQHAFVMFNRQHIPAFQAAGCASVHWLPAACDPRVHRRFAVEKAFDVVFVGQTLRQWHPDRVRLLERLAAAGLSVHVATKILEEMALAFARGRLVFNRSLAGDLNMRVFEALATGSLLLTDSLAPESGLEELLRDREHLVLYDEDNLEALARYYLDHADEREAIAARGRLEVLRQHTYAHRVASLLAAILGEDAEPSPAAASDLTQAAGPVAPSPRLRRRGPSPTLLATPAPPASRVPGDPRLVAWGAPLAAPPAAREAEPVSPGGDAAQLAAYHSQPRPEVAALVPPSAHRILDVGCAGGALGRLLKDRGGVEVVGIEASADVARVAAGHLDQVFCLDLDDIQSLPFPDGWFDCIVCADVLEHLKDPELTLGVLLRYLSAEGRLVASIPNVRHSSVLLPLLVDGRWRYQPEGILDRTHLRFFTLAEILELLRTVGLEADSLNAVTTPLPEACKVLREAVERLGGDPARFDQEAHVVQYLVTAHPAARPKPRAPQSVTTATPAASVIIPVWNRAEYTQACLEALARTATFELAEVIVVDNGSTDETSRLLADWADRVRVITNRENLGFARASNQGARAARGELLVFLNNDTVPQPGWLEALVKEAQDPTIGIVGARLLYPGRETVQHAGIVLGPDGIPDHIWRGVPADDPRVSESRDLDMVTGACLLIRKSLFERLGGLDEGYRNGCEDVDLCLAARRQGYRVRYCADAMVEHHEGMTEGRFAHVRENLQRLFAKWGPTLESLPRYSEDVLRPGPSPAPVTAIWEGSFFCHHSLAAVNREICRELLGRGLDLGLANYEPPEFDPRQEPGLAALAERLDHRPAGARIRVRHRFPPDFSRPAEETLVLIQPWEFGAAPVDWVEGIRRNVDELWVPSQYVKDCFVSSGVAGESVVVIPNGFDPAIFHPDAPAMNLPTAKRFKFLFVGGSISRKGIDVLLAAYLEEFSAADDVCLIIKDQAYYRHRLDTALGDLTRRADAPEVLYFYDDVLPQQMAGYYRAADCLVHPFRGEGFGMPILEAMASGLPVLVTDYGPVREFCPEDAAWFIPCRTIAFPEPRVDHLKTVGHPVWAEPDRTALRALMRHVSEHPEECRARGRRAAEAAHRRFTWAHVADRYAERLTALASSDTAAERGIGPLLARGIHLLQSDRLKEAAGVFLEAARREPQNLEALVGVAHCALALGETELARGFLKHILAVDPEHEGARASLAALDVAEAPEEVPAR
ncbi:MAG: methyltransferase domain-containing protein [Candidatus Rokubacteria bacterium]|nr:methyltransferase domain-containing protein [Candidatus Rokubacteria bacterium]